MALPTPQSLFHSTQKNLLHIEYLVKEMNIIFFLFMLSRAGDVEPLYHTRESSALFLRPVLSSRQRGRVGVGSGVTCGSIGKCLLELRSDGKKTSEEPGQSHAKSPKRKKKKKRERIALGKDESIRKGVHCHGSTVKEEPQRQRVAGPTLGQAPSIIRFCM